MRRVIPALLIGLYLVAGQVPVIVCAADSDSIVVEQAPPLPRHEPQPKKTRRGYVWAQGYWTVSGRHYKWQKGRWIPARPGFEYHQAAWVKVPGGWHLRPGSWQQLPAASVQG